MMSSISLFENTGVVPDLKIFFWIAAYVADAAGPGINPNGTKTLLTNDEVHFSLMVNQLSLKV